MSALHLRVVPWSNSDVHRTIEIASSSTLSDLHSAIQRAYALDDNHLHAFFMNGHLWDREFGVWSDPDPGLPATSSTELRSLGLVRNKRFTYLFDFGAEHCFDVRVVDMTGEAGSRAGRVTESVGKAPAQYGWFDDEDEADEGSAEHGNGADHHAGHVPSPEYADLVRRLEPLVAAWEKREGRDHGEDELDEDLPEDELDEDQAEDELDNDSPEDELDEDVADEDTAAETDDGRETLPQEYALALELLKRTNANAAEIHVHIEHATHTDPMAWLFTLPGRLDAAELFAEAAKLTEQLLPLTPMPSLQAALPRYLASAGRSDESRSALSRNSREEPQDPEVLLESGLTWILLGELGLAEQSLREALKFAGTDADLRHEVLESLEEVLNATGGDVSALLREEQARDEAFQRARTQRMGLPAAPVRRSEPKVGRNDPCPCGSGKKFKKCCGA